MSSDITEINVFCIILLILINELAMTCWKLCFSLLYFSMNAWKSKEIYEDLFAVYDMEFRLVIFWAWDWTFWITRLCIVCVWYFCCCCCVLRFKSVDIVHTLLVFVLLLEGVIRYFIWNENDFFLNIWRMIQTFNFLVHTMRRDLFWKNFF